MYRRTIDISVEMIHKVGYRSHAVFQDHNHHIELTMLFQVGTGIVLEAEANLIRAPFPECQMGIKSVQNLIGFPAVSFKSSREIFKLTAGPTGCTHLAEMVVESVKARLQAADYQRPDWIDPEITEKRYQMWENNWADTCIHYTKPYWKPYNIE